MKPHTTRHSTRLQLRRQKQQQLHRQLGGGTGVGLWVTLEGVGWGKMVVVVGLELSAVAAMLLERACINILRAVALTHPKRVQGPILVAGVAVRLTKQQVECSSFDAPHLIMHICTLFIAPVHRLIIHICTLFIAPVHCLVMHICTLFIAHVHC
jgi:hypothetical protein